jgi:hypothetical protein
LHTGSAIHRHRFVVCLDRNVAVLQKLYDIAEFKAALAISLMEEDS